MAKKTSKENVVTNEAYPEYDGIRVIDVQKGGEEWVVVLQSNSLSNLRMRGRSVVAQYMTSQAMHRPSIEARSVPYPVDLDGNPITASTIPPGTKFEYRQEFSVTSLR